MKIAVVGLGRMGMNIARRLLQKGHEVVAYNRTPSKTELLQKEGATGSFSLEEMVEKLPKPAIVWLMLPAGEVVDLHIEKLSGLLQEGDIIIDGGNTHYRDDLRRAETLSRSGIKLLDIGVSGGIWGLKEGFCLMVGGELDVYERVEPILKALAPEEGYMYCGPTGAGHYVKMVHNGIEYGLMQAYAEGFELLKASEYGRGLDFSALSRLWNHGSVIRSWLLELLERAFKEDPGLDSIVGYVEDSGEGRWTLEEAVRLDVPADTLAISLFKRFRSRQEESFADKVLAALRAQFGGHRVIRKTG
ncbi:MAG: decarboxylating 6-phosphogluconate dehydrogenase [Nitrospirae bacterium]|nr:MAG: decarboxylating 6-phosphogluconate dehydrogenase [Nitrospirota bacterium]